MSLWLFWTIAAVLFLGAIALIYWGLWSDRAKGRLRCPKCWYDMTGSFEAGRLECPECGHDARKEKRLTKNHRRWSAMILGVALLIPHFYGSTVWYDWESEQASVNALWNVMGSMEVRWEPGAPQWVINLSPVDLREYFSRISYVDIGFDSITDKQLIYFRDFRHIREITFTHTKVKGPGLIHLGQLAKLRKLEMINAPITDQGLAYFRGFKTLERLNLFGTDITDDGLQQLGELKNLRNLGLARTSVTAKAIAKAKQMLPNCDIWQ